MNKNNKKKEKREKKDLAEDDDKVKDIENATTAFNIKLYMLVL